VGRREEGGGTGGVKNRPRAAVRSSAARRAEVISGPPAAGRLDEVQLT